MAAAPPRERLRALLAPVVAATGADLEDVSLTTAGSRRVLRVVVDRDGGVDLDAVADVSRAVDGALEDSDVLGGAPYLLEVTSPGVDRPLTEPRHWRRAVGRLVETTAEGSALRGRVVAADDSGVRLEVAGGVREVAYADLGRGRVQVEFAPVGGSPDAADDDTGDEDSGHDDSGHDDSGHDGGGGHHDGGEDLA